MEPLTPRRDTRYRVHSSTLLWVCQSYKKDDSRHRIEHIEIIEGCQRTIYQLEGKSGRFVQYKNGWYLLRTEQEFKALIKKAKGGYVYLFSSEFGVSVVEPNSLRKLSNLPFIMIPGSLA